MAPGSAFRLHRHANLAHSEAMIERTEWLYQWDGFLVTGGLFAVLVIVAECGYRLGRWTARPTGAKTRSDSQAQAIEAAMLSLLGLLLAFTFSMAASRYETRKQVVLQEANALGTAFLRAQLFPLPAQTAQLQDLLRQYATTRLQIYAPQSSTAPAAAMQQAALTQTAALQRQMWALTAANSRQNPNAVSASLLVTTLNEVIDLSETQVTTFANHVPEDILLVLFTLSIIVIAMVAYLNGQSGEGKKRFTLILAATISIAIFLVLDLDRPQSGLIRVGFGSLERVQAMMNAGS